MRYLLCVVLLCAGNLLHAAEFTAKVVAVIDGDTILVKRTHDLVKIRLADIDAPEKAQPFGEAALQSLTEMVKNKEVTISSRAVDDYGRIVAVIRSNNQNINAAQVQRGMAWAISRFKRNNSLLQLQREAQLAKRGLWAEPNAMEPWQWRKQHPFVARNPANKMPSNPISSCGNKKYCAQMTSCAEVLHYFNQCGVRTLDGNGDGMPCETLCSQTKAE